MARQRNRDQMLFTKLLSLKKHRTYFQPHVFQLFSHCPVRMTKSEGESNLATIFQRHVYVAKQRKPEPHTIFWHTITVSDFEVPNLIPKLQIVPEASAKYIFCKEQNFIPDSLTKTPTQNTSAKNQEQPWHSPTNRTKSNDVTMFQ